MYDPENEPEPPKVEQVNDFYKFCWAITATFFSGDRGSVLGQIFKISSHIIECLNEIETNNYVKKKNLGRVVEFILFLLHQMPETGQMK